MIFALVTLAATNPVPQNIPTSITALPIKALPSVSVPAVQMDICVSTTQHHERPRILSQRLVAVRRLPMMLLQDPDNYASESKVTSYDAVTRWASELSRTQSACTDCSIQVPWEPSRPSGSKGGACVMFVIYSDIVILGQWPLCNSMDRGFTSDYGRI